MVKDLADGKVSAEAQEGAAGSSGGQYDKGGSNTPAVRSGFARLKTSMLDLWHAVRAGCWSADEKLIPNVERGSQQRRRRSTISSFFTSGIKDEESEQNGELSPVMIQKAKWAKRSKQPKGRASERPWLQRGETVNKSGGLAVLMPSEERSITPDQEVTKYLKRKRRVESTALSLIHI